MNFAMPPSAYLHNEEFKLYPDFQTGGYIDVSKIQ